MREGFDPTPKAADFGASYLLLTILVAVLGGINPYGGFGKVSGLVLAVLSLQFLSSGFNMLRFSLLSSMEVS